MCSFHRKSFPLLLINYRSFVCCSAPPALARWIIFHGTFLIVKNERVLARATWAWTVFHFLSLAFKVKLHLQFTTPHFFCTAHTFIHSWLVPLIYHKVGFRVSLIRSNWPSQLTRMTFFPLKKSVLMASNSFRQKFSLPSMDKRACKKKHKRALCRSRVNLILRCSSNEKRKFLCFPHFSNPLFFVSPKTFDWWFSMMKWNLWWELFVNDLILVGDLRLCWDWTILNTFKNCWNRLSFEKFSKLHQTSKSIRTWKLIKLEKLN